jgi:hypothetical protein
VTEYIFNPVWQNINWTSLGKFGKIQWHSWIIKFPLYSLFSIILAHFSYKLLEKRLLAFKDKWFKYDTKQQPTVHWQYGGTTEEQSASYHYQALVSADEQRQTSE